MSESDPETTETTEGIDDGRLPDDLVPGDDNPLAEGLDDGETVDDLLTGGKHAEQDDEQDGREGEGSQDGDDGAS